MEFNHLIPELGVADFARSLTFYTEILGFRIEYQRDEDRFAFLSYQSSQIMLEQIRVNSTWKTGEAEYPFGRGLNLQILVDDLAPLVSSLRDHQYPLLVEPAERWYRKDNLLVGLRQLLVMDPDGYLLRFAQSLGTK